MRERVEAVERGILQIELADAVELMKPRIAVFVTLSAMVGYIMASAGAVELGRLGLTLLGTFLTSGGAAALNQYLEREADGRMRRTADRPVPAGRISPGTALGIGIALSAIGLALLAAATNLVATSFAALTSIIYLLLYTPLKPRSVHNTMAGAVSGAIPPVGGWAAVTGSVDAGAWLLFAILFLWQFPHFLGIFWLYREDYARSGYRVLPVEDPDGSRTGRQMLFYSGLLVPVSVLPTVIGLAGNLYGGVALLLSLGLLGASARFDRLRTDGCARGVVRATLVYQPVLWAVLLIDKI